MQPIAGRLKNRITTNWIAPQAADPAAGAALWSLSEKLTGLTFA